MVLGATRAIRSLTPGTHNRRILVQHSSQSRASERNALLRYGERICAERDYKIARNVWGTPCARVPPVLGVEP